MSGKHTIAIFGKTSHVLDTDYLPMQYSLQRLEQAVRSPAGQLVEWNQIVAFFGYREGRTWPDITKRHAVKHGAGRWPDGLHAVDERVPEHGDI